MVSRNYDSEGCNGKFPLYFAVPGHDKVLELGSIQLFDNRFMHARAEDVLRVLGLKERISCPTTRENFSRRCENLVLDADAIYKQSEKLLMKLKCS